MGVTARISPRSAQAPVATMPAVEDLSPAGRVTGIDMARALAILGMFAVHIGPMEADGALGYVYAVPHGRASMLFVLLAGIGVSLLAGSPRTSDGQARLKLLWRTALLLPLGLALQELDHGVAVILQDYALLFVVAIFLLTVPDRWLLSVTALAVPAGSAVYLWGQLRAPDVFAREPVALSDPAVEVGHRLFLSGPYPLITWVAPFVFGIWLGRQDLRSPSARRRLLRWGTGVALGAWALSRVLGRVFEPPDDPTSWERLVVDVPHSQMPLWLVGSTAAAVAVLAASLLVADAARRASQPLVVTGQFALTVYVGHLLVLAAAPDLLTADTVGPAVVILSLFTIVSVVASAAWRAVFSRGPLELVLHAPWLLAARLAPPPSVGVGRAQRGDRTLAEPVAPRGPWADRHDH